ncbi:hypothetical protein VNO78_01848 [Psophocarpus tetragonolobus]|uniref:Uncharacterized protein n=1 Tax=Psophocarpus tetragonolobus TaxID=3891 RepID=A0AAN9T0S4_PSOTE
MMEGDEAFTWSEKEEQRSNGNKGQKLNVGRVNAIDAQHQAERSAVQIREESADLEWAKDVDPYGLNRELNPYTQGIDEGPLQKEIIGWH